jgi:WD40 repeat protein
MDGKLQILEFDPNTMSISEKHFVETTNGVSCAKFFKFKNESIGVAQEFIVLGYEDGQVHAYDLTKFGNSNYQKLVFSVQNHAEPTGEERFCDSRTPHSETVSAIEILNFGNLTVPRIFLTASHDGTLIIWKFVTKEGSEVVESPSLDMNEVFQLQQIFTFSDFYDTQ